MPIKFLQAISDTLIKQKQQSANADSIAVAKLSCLVYSALSSKKNAPPIESFLPFEKVAPSSGLKESTIEAIKWAVKNQPLPPAIVGMIGPELA